MGILYHYTSLDGFMSIINHSRYKMGLWMSSTDYLNDKTERIHSIKVLEKAVEAAENIIGGDKIFTPILKVLSNNESWKLIRYFNQRVLITEYFLTLSLSKKRDFLPLWGRYADNGNGIAIGIDEDLLNEALKENDIFIEEIYYTDSSHINKELFLNFILPNIEEGRKAYLEKQNEPIETVHYMLKGVCGFLKDNNFSYEEEVRVFKYENKYNGDIKYRSSPKGIIPYRILELNKSLIKEIIIGPCEEPELFKQSIIDFYFGKGLKNISSNMVKNSQIPFRK